jgi:hypothetical protein
MEGGEILDGAGLHDRRKECFGEYLRLTFPSHRTMSMFSNQEPRIYRISSLNELLLPSSRTTPNPNLSHTIQHREAYATVSVHRSMRTAHCDRHHGMSLSEDPLAAPHLLQRIIFNVRTASCSSKRVEGSMSTSDVSKCDSLKELFA